MSAIIQAIKDMPPLVLVGQILGILIMIENFFIYFSRSRKNILIFKLISDVANVFSQSFLGAYTGAALNGLGIARETVFYNRDKHKWASSRIWLGVFVVAVIVTSILTWGGPISLLPMCGSVIAVVGFYTMKPMLTRVLGIFAQGAYLIYSIFTFQIGAIIGNSIMVLSAIIGIIRDVFFKKKAQVSIAQSESAQEEPAEAVAEIATELAE